MLEIFHPLLGIHYHRAELVNLKYTFVIAQAPLTEQNRTGRSKLDQHGHYQHDGQK